MKRWPQKIKRLRRRLGLTLGELGALFCGSPALVCQWEKGKYAPGSGNATLLAIIIDGVETASKTVPRSELYALGERVRSLIDGGDPYAPAKYLLSQLLAA